MSNQEPGSSWKAIDLSKLPSESELAYRALSGLRSIYEDFDLKTEEPLDSASDLCDAVFELMSLIGLEVP